MPCYFPVVSWIRLLEVYQRFFRNIPPDVSGNEALIRFRFPYSRHKAIEIPTYNNFSLGFKKEVKKRRKKTNKNTNNNNNNRKHNATT